MRQACIVPGLGLALMLILGGCGNESSPSTSSLSPNSSTDARARAEGELAAPADLPSPAAAPIQAKAITVSVPLRKGWNTIGFRVRTLTSVAISGPAITGFAFQHNGAKVSRPASDFNLAYLQSRSIPPRGVQIYAPSSGSSLDYSGDDSSSFRFVPLQQGLNLVSFPGDAPIPVNELRWSEGSLLQTISSTTVTELNQDGTGTTVDLAAPGATAQPGKAYWMTSSVANGSIMTSEEILASVYSANRVDRIQLNGTVTTAASGGGLSAPRGLAFSSDGSLLVASSNNDRILRYDGALGAFLNVFAFTAEQPRSIVIRGSDVFVSCFYPSIVQRFDGATGANLGDFITANAGGLEYASSFAFSPLNGNLYLVSNDNGRVLAFDGTSGAFLNAAVTTGIANPIQLAMRPNGDYLVACNSASSLKRFNGSTNALAQTIGSGFKCGVGLSRDGSIYVSGVYFNGIQHYAADGTFLETIGSGGPYLELIVR